MWSIVVISGNNRESQQSSYPGGIHDALQGPDPAASLLQ